jgi:hypothetical protein
LLSCLDLNTTANLPQYVPNAVTGLAALSGIFTTFIGFWITYAYLHSNEPAKKYISGWKNYRFALIIFFLFLGLLFIMGSLAQLVYGNYNPFQTSLIGTSIILVVLFDVSMVIVTSFVLFND